MGIQFQEQGLKEIQLLCHVNELRSREDGFSSNNALLRIAHEGAVGWQ